MKSMDILSSDPSARAINSDKPQRSRPLAAITAATLGLFILNPSAAEASTNKPSPADIQSLQRTSNNDLVHLGMPRVNEDGKMGRQTQRALCAERLLKGTKASRALGSLTHSEIVNLNNNNTLTSPKIPESGRTLTSGIIISQTCQVVVAVKNSAISSAFTVSTGKKGHETPNGTFSTQFARNGLHNSTLYPAPGENGSGGNMGYPIYFAPSIAIHSSKEMRDDVTTPLSHGCGRVTDTTALYLYRSLGGNTAVPNDTMVPIRSTPVVVTGAFEYAA